MTVPGKKERIDSDSGFLLLRPDEYSELGGSVSESETGNADVDAFVRKYESVKGRLRTRHLHILKTLQASKGFVLQDRRDDRISGKGVFMYDYIDDFAYHMNKAVKTMFRTFGLKLADNGSFKAVCAFECGCALKIGMAVDGLDGEIKASRAKPDLTCFPRMLAADDFDSCVVEAVKPMDNGRWFDDIYGVARWRAVRALTGRKPDDRPETGERAFLDRLANSSGPEWDSMRDLRDYMAENGELTDIDFGNWGLARRGGQDVPVVFDYDL